MTILNWLSNWYKDNCDGYWEHDFGVKIETIDNPGWSVQIDLINTRYVFEDQEWVFHEKSDGDWYGFKIQGGIFYASGDPGKLDFLLNVFKTQAEEMKHY